MTMPGQIDVISRHLADAVARGGRTQPGRAEDAVDSPYVRPVILTDVPEDSAAVTEETFGPTITVRRVANLEEGIQAPAAPWAGGSRGPGAGWGWAGRLPASCCRPGALPNGSDRPPRSIGPPGGRLPPLVSGRSQLRRVKTENHPEWERFPISIANPL